MFTFDDSPLSGATGPHAYAPPGSPTPIFDRLFEEWQRMFRAVPGDRYGEGFAGAGGRHSAMQSGVQVYSSGGYSVPSSMPSQMSSQMPSSMHSSTPPPVPSSMPLPAFRPEQGQGQGQGYPQGFGGSEVYGAAQNLQQHGGPQPSGSHQVHTPPGGSQMDTPPPMHSQETYDAYAQQSRPAPVPMPTRSGGSGLALMPVAGYQAQHMPL